MEPAIRRIDMRVKLWTIGSSVLLCLGVARAQTPHQGLHQDLVRLVQERGPSKGWVFFVDKDLHAPAELAEAVDKAQAELHPRALERRARRRTSPGLADVRDVPVHRAYVDQVLATGVELSIESSWLNAISVRGTEEQFRALAQLSFVDRIEPVRRGTLSSTTYDGGESASLGGGLPSFYGIATGQLAQMNLIAVHLRGYTGTGVVIGVLDTGFHRGHEAFNTLGHEVDVLAEYDFLDDDPFTGMEPGDPSAQHNHGTMVLGTIAAYLPFELVGGAFDASFILVKTEDTTDEYQQEEDFYVAGLQFIEAHGGDVATSSLAYDNWYTPSDFDGLTAVTTLAVNTATSNGLHCCTASGNSGNDADPGTWSLAAPSDAFDVISCGAVDPDDDITSFSSDGPSADGRVKPEILARGVQVMTLCAHQDVDCTTDTGGTSFSTPLIASVVACLIQAHPDWTPAHMRRQLFQSGSDYRANGTFDPLYVRGYGVPDADLAGFTLASSFCDDFDGALAACPCGNPGTPDTGCDLQQATGGVGLTIVSQETSPGNAVTWSASGFPATSTPTSIVIRAASLDTGSPIVFGDGLRCIGTPVVRLAATFASAGTVTHTHGHGAAAGSGTSYYQLWFRNTPVMFCAPSAAFNLSNGRTLSW
jgi:hypothetical protein